ncbi:hypothetical protein LUZ60_013631 [Juncus effusus]|nr:hypothetical protein LUZ60_013631 [Juncus effusus]
MAKPTPAPPPPANSNPNPKPNSEPNKPVSLNPNWAQLQSKLRSRNPSFRPETASDSVLGKRKERPLSDPDADVDLPSGLDPLSDDASLTKVLAVDCEMVGVSSLGNKSALARVTLVNSFGNVIYDEYVRPVERIVDYRTSISGIRPKHMKNAKDLLDVQKKVADFIKGRILVGHALHHDLKVLLLSHPKKDIRDTSDYEPLRREGKKRALKDLATEILRVKIQQKEHNPVEDARAAMYIYNKYKKAWEKSLKSQFRLKNKFKNKQKNKSNSNSDLA